MSATAWSAASSAGRPSKIRKRQRALAGTSDQNAAGSPERAGISRDRRIQSACAARTMRAAARLRAGSGENQKRSQAARTPIGIALVVIEGTRREAGA